MALTIVKKEISLNVSQPNNFELICAMQGDSKTFEITATLYDVNKLYTINTNNIKVKGINPVGLKIEENINSHTTNTVTFTLTEKMLMYDGLLKLVIIFNDDGQLTSFPFIIKVVGSPGNATADDVKTLSELVEEAKKWALLSKSYAIGTDNEVRDGDKTDNSKFYYEESKKAADGSKEYYDKIQSLINSGSIGGGTGNSNILYYDTYEEFKADLDAGEIPNETLICVKESKITFTVKVIKDDNMSWDSTSGKETQDNVMDSITPIIYTAKNGYYFPSDYNVSSVNGISVARNSDNKITVSGTPTDDTQITLKAPTRQKTTQNPPTGLSDGGLKINGTTSAMEYASSPTASTWTSCTDGSTSVTEGTWYVRYKETDSLYASDSISIIIVTPEPEIEIGTNIDDWGFDYNPGTNEIELRKYLGTESNVIVYGKYKIETGFHNGKLFPNDVIVQTKIMSCSSGLESSTTQGFYMFAKNTNVKSITFNKGIDTTETYSMGYMFEGCSSLTKLDISNLDTSHTYKFNAMFSGVTSPQLNNGHLDLTNFDTSIATLMFAMFYGMQIKSIDLSSFDTSKVQDCLNMFTNTQKLEEVKVSSSKWTINPSLSSSGISSFTYV